ncbi:MAG TPA: type III-A CRISPR-associated protein Cas10/Csm1 [Thermodesulfobacteriota bacterium]|nr:type III-A CRISPR-associated protein Cas10/Csm1 [Thermodesulfobacteriota bacterium]
MAEREAVILGALLHDIGKFVQRAQSNPTSQDHSHWGEEWFEKHLAEKLAPIFDEDQKGVIRGAISNHHKHVQYISLADGISAGLDRTKIDLETEEKGDPFTSRLMSIFSRVSISNNPKKDMYYQLKVLGENNLEEVFPSEDKTCSYEEYHQLLNKFDQELESKDFSCLSSQQAIDSLYFLLWKYTWCIPSAVYLHEPDISLFDHLKTTAAITACLYDYSKEHVGEPLSLATRAFCLAGGDISGIQGYIFDVLSQQGKVAKRLRARSLFVQLISEIASHKILHTVNLPLCNVIISAGGNFYVLLPNCEGALRKIEEDLQREFDSWAIDQLGGELSISLAALPLCGKELTNFTEALDKVKAKLNYRKYHPHHFKLVDNGRWSTKEFLRPEVIEGDEKACRGCHKYPVQESLPNEELFCERCLNNVIIGKDLPNTQYLAFFGDNQQGYSVLNYSFELWGENDLSLGLKKKPYLVFSLNPLNTKLLGAGFKFLATHIPTKKEIPQANTEGNTPVTFDDVCAASNGDKLLGYIKADVDRLGEILRKGFSASKPSISRFASFSRMLETFFAGYLQRRLKDDFGEMYTVFSGGDDFFLVGPWDKTIEFSQEIRNQFSRFCANNPDLTFSTGIVLAKPHEPVSFCAESAEKKLKRSKQQEGKNKITFFDQTIAWTELDQILKEAKKVITWLEKEPPIISRSLVNNFRQYGEMSRIFNEEGKVEYLKYVPLLTYDINRNLQRDIQREAYEWANDLRPSTDNPQGGKSLPFLRTIMEYVLTYTRS